MTRKKTYADGLTKQQRYKLRNAEKVREYQRELMRQRRATAKKVAKRAARKVKP